MRNKYLKKVVGRPLRYVMIYTICLLALGACKATNGPDPPESPGQSVRVLAYNIHHAEGMDGVIDLVRIAELIKSVNPDVATLQEVDSMTTRTGGVDQAGELGRLTGYFHAFSEFMPYQGGAYGMAVLSRWPILEARTLRLPDGEEPRTSLAVTVETEPSGEHIRVVGIHFYKTEEQRMAQAVSTEMQLQESQIPTLLMGDFNSEPHSPVMSKLSEHWTIVDKGEDHLTFSSFEPVKEIDYALLGKESGIEVLSQYLIDEPVISDHRPYVVDLLLTHRQSPSPGENEVARLQHLRSKLDPPFSGTIFIDPDIITAEDRSSFLSATYSGQGIRSMYDRRPAAWIQNNAFLFAANFDDGLTAEIQVNSEFSTPEAALFEALKYGLAVGRLPTSLRMDMETMWIHKGNMPFGGGNNNILIHTEQAADYIQAGILEETLVHEASHTSLDEYHATAPGWIAAQQADPDYISTYARDNSGREDIAESFLTWLAVRHKADSISEEMKDIIESTIPNRLLYFDGLDLDLYPLVGQSTDLEVPETMNSFVLNQNFPNPFSRSTRISFFVPDYSRVSIKVVDIQGKKICSLVDAFVEAGSHFVEWTGTDSRGRLVPSGVYYYILDSGASLRARPMTLVR